MLTDNELWLLSYYRSSEIAGALFFGRMARILRPGRVQVDLTQHFADEAQHAAYWSRCIEELGAVPLKLRDAYQDAYLEAAGLPANLMEILSITHAFERRVSTTYSSHARVVGAIHPTVAATLSRIIKDERWHLDWVRRALHDLEPKLGADNVRQTIQRHIKADETVWTEFLREHGERVAALVSPAGRSTT
jgi:bacterioferritin (cytochrome b1)